MLPLLDRFRARSGSPLALGFTTDGVVIARMETAADGHPHLCAEALPGERVEPLAERLRSCGLEGATAHLVMPLGSYERLLLDQPPVPPAELRAALRWRVRELIDFHIDDAVIDHFPAPRRPDLAQQQLYVIVARRRQVERYTGLASDAGLQPSRVDIPELALRNLACRLPETATGVALVHLEADRGLILLCRDHCLYLARNIDLGSEHLAAGGTAATERLALEIQRTLDYYDRHFRQPPVALVALTPLPDGLPPVTEELAGLLGIDSRILDLNQLLDPRPPYRWPGPVPAAWPSPPYCRTAPDPRPLPSRPGRERARAAHPSEDRQQLE